MIYDELLTINHMLKKLYMKITFAGFLNLTFFYLRISRNNTNNSMDYSNQSIKECAIKTEHFGSVE